MTEERLERLTKGIAALDLESPRDYSKEEGLEETIDDLLHQHKAAEDMPSRITEASPLNSRDSTPGRVSDDGNHLQH